MSSSSSLVIISHNEMERFFHLFPNKEFTLLTSSIFLWYTVTLIPHYRLQAPYKFDRRFLGNIADEFYTLKDVNLSFSL